MPTCCIERKNGRQPGPGWNRWRGRPRSAGCPLSLVSAVAVGCMGNGRNPCGPAPSYCSAIDYPSRRGNSSLPVAENCLVSPISQKHLKEQYTATSTVPSRRAIHIKRIRSAPYRNLSTLSGTLGQASGGQGTCPDPCNTCFISLTRADMPPGAEKRAPCICVAVNVFSPFSLSSSAPVAAEK